MNASAHTLSSPRDERPRLEPGLRAFGAVYGWSPSLADFGGEVDGGFTITVRPEIEPIELLGGTGHFRHRPAMTAHVRRMGFAWNDANRIVTMPERVSGWRSPGASGPLTLTTFFDNDLNRYGYAVWSRSETPSDFARLFAAPRHFAQLTGCLDCRIDETLRGLGDVSSGVTGDMPPLAPYEFRVEG